MDSATLLLYIVVTHSLNAFQFFGICYSYENNALSFKRHLLNDPAWAPKIRRPGRLLDYLRYKT